MSLWRHQVRDLINGDETFMFPLISDICKFLTEKSKGITNDIWEFEFYSTRVNVSKNKKSSAVFENDVTESTYHNMYDYISRELEKINTELLIYKLDLITKKENINVI